MTQQTDRELIQRLTGALDELRDLIPAIKDGSYEPDSFTLQPLESAIQDVSIALAQPEPEVSPWPVPGDAEGLAEVFWSRCDQPEPKGVTEEQWDAIKERLWDNYETFGNQGERFMYEGDFYDALDVARQDLAPAQPELEGGQVRGIFNCRWDGPPPSPHASVSDWFEQEGSKGILYGLRISALPSRNEVPRAANFWLEGMQP
jgi:hypothetical protein